MNNTKITFTIILLLSLSAVSAYEETTVMEIGQVDGAVYPKEVVIYEEAFNEFSNADEGAYLVAIFDSKGQTIYSTRFDFESLIITESPACLEEFGEEVCAEIFPVEQTTLDSVVVNLPHASGYKEIRAFDEQQNLLFVYSFASTEESASSLLGISTTEWIIIGAVALLFLLLIVIVMKRKRGVSQQAAQGQSSFSPPGGY